MLQVGVAVQSAQHLLWGDEDANDGEQGDGGQEFDFHELKWEGFEDIWGWGGEAEEKEAILLSYGRTMKLYIYQKFSFLHNALMFYINCRMHDQYIRVIFAFCLS